MNKYTIEQNIEISGQIVIVKSVDIRIEDWDKLVAVLETELNSIVYKALYGEGWTRGIKLNANFEGSPVSIELDLITKVAETNDGNGFILEVVCSGMDATGNLDGSCWEFTLPNVSFGDGDFPYQVKHGTLTRNFFPHIEFSVNNRKWQLCHLFKISDSLHPVEDLPHLIKTVKFDLANIRKSDHTILRVETTDNDKSGAEETATEICNLLSLALAQPVGWSEMRKRAGSASVFVCRRALVIPKKKSGLSPITNRIDCEIKKYIEAAYPVYKADKQWWLETLNWYAIAMCDINIEVAAMTFSMLLERVSSKLLKDHSFLPQVGNSVEPLFKDRKSEAFNSFSADVTTAIKKHIPEWKDERTLPLLTYIQMWNARPSYKETIKVAFAKLNLRPPSKLVMDHRNDLMHSGSIDLKTENIHAYFKDIHEQVLVLLLCYLRFDGKFFCFGKQIQEIQNYKTCKVDVPA